MPLNLENLIGLTAAVLTTLGFLPQLLKSWRSKSTADISLPMLAVFAAGIVLWLIYGLILKAFPIILANSFTLILISCIIGLKLKYK